MRRMRCVIAAGSVWGASRAAGAGAGAVRLPVCFLLPAFIIRLRSRERKRFLVAIVHKLAVWFLVLLRNPRRKRAFQANFRTYKLL